MSAPSQPRQRQREKLGNLLEDVPDKCMDVDAIGIRAWRAFGISESSCSLSARRIAWITHATQPSGNFTAFVRDGRNTSERSARRAIRTTSGRHDPRYSGIKLKR